MCPLGFCLYVLPVLQASFHASYCKEEMSVQIPNMWILRNSFPILFAKVNLKSQAY